GKLQQDAAHLAVAIALLDHGGHLLPARARAEVAVVIDDPNLPRDAPLVAHVDLRGGVVADKDRRQPRGAPGLADELLDIAGDLRPNAGSRLAAVDDRDGHGRGS